MELAVSMLAGVESGWGLLGLPVEREICLPLYIEGLRVYSQETGLPGTIQ